MSRYYELESGNTKSLVDIIIDLEDAVGEANLNRDIAKSIALEIGEERDMLAYENKNMADFIQFNDRTLYLSDISDIANSTEANGVWCRFKKTNYPSKLYDLEVERDELLNRLYLIGNLADDANEESGDEV